MLQSHCPAFRRMSTSAAFRISNRQMGIHRLVTIVVEALLALWLSFAPPPFGQHALPPLSMYQRVAVSRLLFLSPLIAHPLCSWQTPPLLVARGVVKAHLASPATQPGGSGLRGVVAAVVSSHTIVTDHPG